MRHLRGQWLCGLLFVFSSALASGATITRGPFLQRATETSITIHFTSSAAGIGRVRYGPSPQSLTSTVTESASGTLHTLLIQGLAPATRYFYALDLDGTRITGLDLNGAAVADGEYTFRTSNISGSPEPFRLFAWGDSGTGTSSQFAVANRMAAQLNDAALSIILGDIIYPDGAPQDYDPNYFKPYQAMLRRMTIWPVVGNHDVMTDPAGAPWKAAFNTPANNPTNDELYYSFDYGNAHFIVLDTHVNSFSNSSAQMVWARADLAASSATWKVAAFHVPPWTGGTHSDNAAVITGILPSLEAAGVDIVLAGHSHVYERTFLIKNSTILQNDFSTYSKATATDGTIYVVSGTAGQSGALSLPNHPMMAYQRGTTLGATVIDFNARVARGYFLLDDGSSVDLFTLSKGADTQPPRLLAARATSTTQLELAFSEPLTAGSGTTGAERIANYTLSSGRAVTAAVLQSDLRTVKLTTAAHANGAYLATVSNVTDRASPVNAIGTENQAPYTVGPPIPFDGGVDSGISDAGQFDAGRPDAGAADAGRDAGTTDAGPADAGVSVDGGPPPDGGAISDSGLLDAGEPDSGTPDAGNPAPDASSPDASVLPPLHWVAPNTPIRYLVAANTTPDDWQGYRFDDSLWATALQPLGSGLPGLDTDVPLDAGTRILARFEFDVTSPRAEVETMRLFIRYQSGYIAWLNGTEVSRSSNAGTAAATSSHSYGTGEWVDISNARSLLVDGDNFLAIEAQTFAERLPTIWVQAELLATTTASPPPPGPLGSVVVDAGSGVNGSAPVVGTPCGCSTSTPTSALWLLGVVWLIRRRRVI